MTRDDRARRPLAADACRLHAPATLCGRRWYVPMAFLFATGWLPIAAGGDGTATGGTMPPETTGAESAAPQAGPAETADEAWRGFWIGALRIGGALRVNYTYKDWDEDFKDLGEFAFDTARINLDLDGDHVIGSFEYRYYRDKFADGHDYSMLHHGWLGWKFDDRQRAVAGVTKVPFGILPYASHNWFFQIPYYVGLEDDYDLGIKYVREDGTWDVQAAYFPQDEGTWFGDSDDSARYSYDLVREGTAGNAERHQLNVRLAYTVRHADAGDTELGLSLMGGSVPNDNPRGHTGYRYALAAHLNGTYDRWNLMLQVVRYEFDVDNDSEFDASPDGKFVTMGAYDAAYDVAAKGTFYTAGLAYAVPVEWAVIEAITFYDDFGLLVKDESDFRNSVQNIVGCSVDAGLFYVYVDLSMGRNHPWFGGNWTTSLAAGEGSEWHTRFNVNIGFYF